MASKPNITPILKQNLLSRVFSRFRKAPKSRDPPVGPTSTQASGNQAHKRSTDVKGELGAAHAGPSALQPQVPTIRVEDRSKHHHGDTYNSHGTANFVGSVANATFGSNSVTTIERATIFSSGNEAVLLWDTLPKRRDTVVLENEYLEESREDVIQDVLRWSKDPTSELALFIVGAAGVGKSTLARHLTYRLHAVGRLAAFVSLSALQSDARSAESIVKLASREIGGTHPGAIPAILEAIKLCKGASLVKCVEMFLIGPVRSLGLSHSLTVIFDAVDEYEFQAALVKTLSSLSLSSSLSIKFILLGRSDPRTRGIDHGAIRPYQLQPVSIPVMERFLTIQFDGVRWGHGRRPTPSRVTKLAELTNGLFIWATVVCSLLKKRLSRFAPDHILDSILDARKTLGDGEQLATLYHQAITLLFPDSDARDLLREYLTATLALQVPLPIDEFSDFTGLPTHAIKTIQTDLKALQIRQPEEGSEENSMVYPAGSLFHLSFLEYLESTSTPPAITFHVSMFSSHSQLAGSCFKELPRFLPSSRPLSYLDLRPRERYAVTYLMVHVHHGSPSVQPGSAEEWECSSHCATLRRMSIELLQQWANLFLRLIGGAPKVEEYAGGDSNIREDNDELDADHDATDDADVTEEDMDHDTRVAQVLNGVAATFWEKEYTFGSSFRASCLEVAVRLRPDEAEYWHDLGWVYYTVAQWNGSIEAHYRAVTARQNALRGAEEPIGHDPGKFPCALATALHERSKAVGRPEDLYQAIALHREGLAVRPPGHPQRRISLNSLSISLGTYVRQRGSSEGRIDEVVSLQREALGLLPRGDKNTSLYLRNLALNLRSRYEVASSIVDLEEAIQLGREALALCPLGHTYRAWALNELARDLTLLYEAQGNAGPLDEATLLGIESLSLCPTGHPRFWDTLDTLSNTLRFEPEHLDEALQLSRESFSLAPFNHSYRWQVLLGLASTLHSHYERSGSAEELEEAISVCELALTLCPANHIRRPRLLALQAKLATAASSSSIKS